MGTYQNRGECCDRPLQIDVTTQPIDLSGANVTGILKEASFPALTGDVTTTEGSFVTTLATVNSNVYGTNSFLKFAVNAKGLITSATPVLDTDVTGKVLTGYVSGPGTVSATDSILSAIQKLNGNIAAISGSYVTTFSGGTTGLTPATATSGAITLGGILSIANGGTGSTVGAILNQTSPQSSSNFNISGTGIINTSLAVGKSSVASNHSLDVLGQTQISYTANMNGTLSQYGTISNFIFSGALTTNSTQLIYGGMVGQLAMGGTGTASFNSNTVVGAVIGKTYVNTSGTYNKGSAVVATSEFVGSANVTNFSNIHSLSPYRTASGSYTGSITNYYGLYMEASDTDTGITITNKYAIYQAGANDRVYLAGMPSYASGGSYVVSNSGILSTRTAAEVATDIGAISSSYSYYIGTTLNALNRASGAQTLTGVSIDGNAGTVTNGVYTTGSYADPSWITSLSPSKVGLTTSTWVDIASTQTITGAKTFRSNVTIDGTATGMDINPTTGLPNITFRSGNTFRGYIEGNSSGGLSFGAGPSATIYYTISSTGANTWTGSGTFGGDISTSGNFTVNSQINFTNTGTNISGDGSGMVQLAGTGGILYYINGAYRGLFNSSGNLLWGSITDHAGERLQITGTSYFSGAATFASSVQSTLFYKNYASPGGVGSPTYETVLGFGASGSNYGAIQFSNEYSSNLATGFRIRLTTQTNVTYDAFTIVSSGGVVIASLSGSGNRIVYANASGLLGSMVIGSGLSFDGTTLTATGGSSGTVTGTGTSGYIPLWNIASDIGNSVMSQSGGSVSTTGAFTAGTDISAQRVFSLGGSYGLVQSYNAGGAAALLRAFSSTSYFDIGVRHTNDGNVLLFGKDLEASSSTGGSVYATLSTSGIFNSAQYKVGTGTTYMNIATDVGGTYQEFAGATGATQVLRLQGTNGTNYVQFYLDAGNQSFYAKIASVQYFAITSSGISSTAGSFSSSVTASSFSGAGTGLTGTASSLTAGAVTNGVYTTGSYSDPAWITAINYSKLTGTIPTWNQNTTGSAGSVANTLTIGTDLSGISYNGSAAVTINNTSTLSSVTGRGATTASAISITNATASSSTATGALIVTGGVGIGGAVYAGGAITATTFYKSSDSRLKEIISTEPTIYGIENLKAKLYLKNGKMEIGYIAQEAQTYLPYAISTRADGYLDLDYEQVLVAKVSSVEKRVEILEEENEKLKQQILKLGGSI